MKIMTKSVATVAALAMAATGVFSASTNASAATVATVHSGVVARLYTPQGSQISNRALSPNSAWQVGKVSTINGETMYQVSTNEYLRAADSSLNGQQHSTKLAGKAMSMLALYRDDTNGMADRSLAPNSEWLIGKYVVNRNGQQFVQVSTHEYADASKLMYTQPMENPTYIADFGTNTKFSDFAIVGSGNLSGSNNTDTSTSTNTDQNAGSTTTAPSQPSTGMMTGSSEFPMPAASEVQAAVVTSINKERATRGLSPVTVDPTITSIAQKRAQEISTNFTHYDANGNEVYKTYLHQQTSYLSQGENISGDPWVGLHTSAELADTIMDSFRAEGISSTWNHYSAIINPNATKIGVGVHLANDGMIYTVEDFAN